MDTPETTTLTEYERRLGWALRPQPNGTVVLYMQSNTSLELGDYLCHLPDSVTGLCYLAEAIDEYNRVIRD